MKPFKPIDNFATTNTKYMYQLEKNKKHSTGTHKSTSWGKNQAHQVHADS
jgi:hypothetical protein